MKLVLLVLAGIAAHAATITSGTIQFTGKSSPTFQFTTDEFDVTGRYAAGWFQFAACNPCEPGSYVSLRGAPVGGDFYGGTVNGTGVWWDNPYAPNSRFEWSGQSIQPTGPGSYLSTFTLDGQLCGGSGTRTDPPCPYLFSAISGSGSAMVDFIPVSGPSGVTIQIASAVFTFEAPQSQSEQAPEISNPEPASWALMALGLVAVMAGCRRMSGINRS